MFGTVTEWYYRWLAGIRPIAEKPGFEEFVLAPTTPAGLNSVNCTYNSPFGEIVSNWKKEESGTCVFEISIPAGTRANVTIPMEPAQKIQIKRKEGSIEPDKIEGLQSGKFQLGEGEYVIIANRIK
jgi:alpha-L-rhamnosidase